jgi:hypothetical protein
MNKQTVNTLAKEAIKAPRVKKQVKLVQEAVTLADGASFTPMEVKTSSDVLRASLLTLFKHVADIHVTVVEIIADKFGHSVEDLHAAITEDPRWQQMLVDPVIADLTKTAETHSVPAVKSTKKRAPIVIADEPELVFD